METLSPFPGAEFHHLGVACADPDKELRGWLELGYVAEEGKWEDSLQGVAIRFLCGPGPRIELLSPLAGSTTLDPYLRGASKIYHMGYLVKDLDASLAAAQGHCRVVSPPKPACAFGGKRVAFVLLRNMLLVELIEHSHHE